ncbi:MAG TPA: UbiA family prenyltransferase [Candidatus Koribacter sp.]|jgi:4-hydroxybenzoate polyprenyltransferase
MKAEPVTESVVDRTTPLCVDLDGTLVKSDTLVDSIFALVRQEPATAWRLPFWVLGGKPKFKHEIAQRAQISPETLPYNQPLLEYLSAEHAAGRKIYLATASDERLATAIADYLGLFAGVIATNGGKNLAGKAKLEALEEKFGAQGFEYIGNAAPDKVLLKQAKVAMLANPSAGLESGLRRQGTKVERVFEDRRPKLKSLIKAVRVSQWPKNILIFVPMLLAHVVSDRTKLLSAVIAFFCFSFAASATYIVNDLLDMEADRRHARKRRRPFAAGELSGKTGAAIAAVLLVISAVLARMESPRFIVALGVYFVTTLAYSFVLKKMALLDVLTLAGLYTVRLWAGAGAAHVPLSPWFLTFSLFFFLSLAVVKRYSELHNLRQSGSPARNGRGYHVDDIEQLRSFGTAAGYASVVVFSLYINNPDITRLYRHPHWLWLMAPLLIYWISRIWLLAHRGELDEDPVVFALTDKWSPLFALIALVVMRGAI